MLNNMSVYTDLQISAPMLNIIWRILTVRQFLLSSNLTICALGTYRDRLSGDADFQKMNSRFRAS